MPVSEKIGRRNCIPVIYCRGTHYEVGFDVGRTFSSLIQSFVAKSGPLNKVYLPLYDSPEGRKAYDATLATCKENFPQYVREIEGTADGAQVPFHKLFLLHMDDILPNSVQKKSSDSTNGCSTICCNQPNQEFLGHNEDALTEVLNHIYFVSAHIIEDSPQGRWKVKEEKFTSLCYAGTLPGFTMSYNHHGFVFSVNIVSAKTLVAGKTPRYFLTRALLAAENLLQAQQILRDTGVGAGDGVSINMTFLTQEGNRVFHNAEVGPAVNAKESPLSILTVSPGEMFFHTNKYLRLQIPEVGGMIVSSSDRRHATQERLPGPQTAGDVITVLGDLVQHWDSKTLYLRLQIPEVGGMIVSSSDRRHATQERLPGPQTAGDIITVLGDLVQHWDSKTLYLRLQIPEVGGMIVSSSDRRHATQERLPGPQTAGDVITVLGDLVQHWDFKTLYLRLQIPEVGGMIVSSSDRRHATQERLPGPQTAGDVITVLGDQSDKEFTIFRESGDDDYVKTVAVGIFDCVNKTWSIYADNPKNNKPIVVLPIELKSSKNSTT